MAMDWLQIALQNPIDNWTVWFLLAIAVLRIVEFGVKSFGDVQRDNVVLMRDMQSNTQADNTLHGRLIDEMTARRVSDETMKNRLADILEETVHRIDGTTLDTNIKAGTIIKETQRTQKALKILYQELRSQGILK